MHQNGIKLFNLPNLLTSANGIFGILAIILAFFGRLEMSAICLIMAMVFDFFDGFTARLMGITSPIGKDLDSLADMISFGLAPGMLMFMTMELRLNGNLSAVYQKYHTFNLHHLEDGISLSALSIPFFSMFRLAKFNNDLRQSDRFIGLPTPANALFFLFFPLLLEQSTSNSITADSGVTYWLMHPWTMATICLCFPLLLIAEIPLLSLKFKHFQWRGNELRWALLGISLITIFPLRIYAIPIVILLYLILSFIEQLIPQQK